MTERQGGLRPQSVEAIEVPLTGAEHASTDGDGDPGGPPAPNWRRAVAIGLVGGVIGGIALAVIVSTSDDEPDTEGVEGDPLAVEITTPPTLPALAVPPGETPAPAVVPTEPAVTVPDYRDVDGPFVDAVQYDIAAAVAAHGDDLPRRSVTRIEYGVGGLVLHVTIERDPGVDRYRLVLESPRSVETLVVDGRTATTYVTSDSLDTSIEISNADILSRSDATSINEYFDRLMLGPVRPDTFAATSTRGRALVTLPGAGTAREFTTRIDGGSAPEWQLYALGPVQEFLEQDRPSQLDYRVYVTEDGRITQVDGVASIGGVDQLVRHRVTVLDEPLTIDLPAG